ncbi:ATP-binding protein [Taylorella asinigenitalis]|uniref:ATP-binding protein n=1 Tax=Taylorella asinigenitalis TaxID=84590 RepID=UPI000A86A104|nr:ATP-binding protein [Taylorella asinigenitalis]
MEIDFIATQNNMKLYIQVAYKVESPETVEREFKPLLAVKDNYPKFVISTDESNLGNHEGIEHKNIVDFLMEGAQI